MLVSSSLVCFQQHPFALMVAVEMNQCRMDMAMKLGKKCGCSRGCNEVVKSVEEERTSKG